MIASTLFAKIAVVAAFLLLFCLLACEKPTDLLPSEAFANASGTYRGDLAIDADTFPDIEVMLEFRGDELMWVGSPSDLVRPFSCRVEYDGDVIYQADDGQANFLSVNLTGQPYLISIVYSRSGMVYQGKRVL